MLTTPPGRGREELPHLLLHAGRADGGAEEEAESERRQRVQVPHSGMELSVGCLIVPSGVIVY